MAAASGVCYPERRGLKSLVALQAPMPEYSKMPKPAEIDDGSHACRASRLLLGRPDTPVK